MADTLTESSKASAPRLEASNLAWWCLAIFVAAAVCEIAPVAAAKAILAPLPKSAAESYPFTLVIALGIFAGLALQAVSSALALFTLWRSKWKDRFAALALGCNAVMVILYAVV